MNTQIDIGEKVMCVFIIYTYIMNIHICTHIYHKVICVYSLYTHIYICMYMCIIYNMHKCVYITSYCTYMH